MMSRTTQMVLGVLACVLLLWLLWTLAQSLWWTPVAELRARRSALQKQVDEYRNSIDSSDGVTSSIDVYVENTLGSTLEQVDHRLRSRLNRVGEAVGIEGLSVGTGRSTALLSPGKADFKGSSRRELREEIDFVEVEATLSGRTDWAGVLELIDRIVEEPWIKTIDHVRLRREGTEGRLGVTVRMRTLFLPGREPRSTTESSWNSERLVALSGLAGQNPFLASSASSAAESKPPAARPKSAPARWQVTAIAELDGVAEVWIRNLGTGRTRRLGVGERHAGLVLKGISGDRAEFGSGEAIVSIQVGGLLRDTAPVHK